MRPAAPTIAGTAAHASRSDLTQASVTGALTALLVVLVLLVPRSGWRHWFSWGGARCLLPAAGMALSALVLGGICALFAASAGFTLYGLPWAAGIIAAAVGIRLLMGVRQTRPAPMLTDASPADASAAVIDVVRALLARLESWMDDYASDGVREWVNTVDSVQLPIYIARVRLDMMPVPWTEASAAQQAKVLAAVDGLTDPTGIAALGDAAALARDGLLKTILRHRLSKREMIAIAAQPPTHD